MDQIFTAIGLHRFTHHNQQVLFDVLSLAYHPGLEVIRDVFLLKRGHCVRLANRVAVEPNEMLGTVPPSAIKYCVIKGWLLPNAGGTLYRITLKGAIELNLPMHFRGVNGGRKIPFVR